MLTPQAFNINDPFDRDAPIRLLIPRLHASRDFMRSIRNLSVPADAIALWFLGQNGFLLKDSSGLLIGIDLYLTDSCAHTFAYRPARHNRQLPIFIEPEDLDLDIFIATHSHDDHADPETLRRLPKSLPTLFLGPFDAQRIFRESGVPAHRCRLLHPGETLALAPSTSAQATFAIPTDTTDLNHTGVLLTFANGITFYNTGDTAYAERLSALLPLQVDLCAICINGGFHNLGAPEAARIVTSIRPRVVIPCHYDMMINNVGSPLAFRNALEAAGSTALFHQMPYYEPWLYRRTAAPPAQI